MRSAVEQCLHPIKTRGEYLGKLIETFQVLSLRGVVRLSLPEFRAGSGGAAASESAFYGKHRLGNGDRTSIFTTTVISSQTGIRSPFNFNCDF